MLTEYSIPFVEDREKMILRDSYNLAIYYNWYIAYPKCVITKNIAYRNEFFFYYFILSC